MCARNCTHIKVHLFSPAHLFPKRRLTDFVVKSSKAHDGGKGHTLLHAVRIAPPFADLENLKTKYSEQNPVFHSRFSY